MTVGLENKQGLFLRKLIGYELILVIVVAIAVTQISAFLINGVR